VVGGVTGRPGVDHPPHARRGAQVADGRVQLGAERRVGRLTAVDQAGDHGAAAGGPGEHVGDEHRLGVAAQPAAGVEPAEHLTAET
jgi:hypothetical protein